MSDSDHPTPVSPHPKSGEEEELSKEEAEAMRAELLAKARGVQQLIVTLQENEAKLKDIVQDFVLREYAEQQVGASLNNRVELQQVSHLQNPQYVRWAVENRKGEYDEKRGLLSEEEYLQSQYDKEQESHLSWLLSLPIENQPLHAASLIDSTIPMLAQWRQSTHYHLLMTEGFCLRFDKHLLSKGGGSSVLFFVNGQPLVDTKTLRCILEPQCNVGEKNIESNIITGLTPVFQQFQKEWKLASSVNSQYELYRDLTLLFASRFDLFTTLTASCPSLPEILVPENNVISAVPLTLYREAVLMRCFVFQDKLVAVENLEPEVLDSFALLDLSQSEVISRIKGFVSGSAHLALKGRSAVTLLISKERLTVIDIQTFSPELAFKWKFSYTDLCGIGSASRNQTEVEPVIRRTTVEAARLKPFDELSKLVLEAVERSDCNVTQNKEQESELRRKSGLSLGTICVIAAGVGLGVAALVRAKSR